ncbi:MAG: prepilin peptidase, partial [Pirellulaceae bacterium]|nr:prepilin peptidase [Pirellulaceae bacterium]
MGLIVFAIGASVGSFLNVVADRLPSGGSVVRPRSFCDNCRRPLSNFELIPIFSYLIQRGRCRHCGARIPVRVLLVEVATATLFLSVYFKLGFGIEFWVVAAASSVLLAIAVIDFEYQPILNKMILPAIA